MFTRLGQYIFSCHHLIDTEFIIRRLDDRSTKKTMLRRHLNELAISRPVLLEGYVGLNKLMFFFVLP